MARFLGIDISNTAIRGVLLRSAMRKLEVERYVEITLREAPQSPGRAHELLEAGRALRQALPFAPDAIIAGLTGEETSLRVVELPTAAKKRIGEVLPFELEAVLPYDPHEAVIDYQPVDTQGSMLRVLAASVLRKHVKATLDDLRAAELEPRELAAGAAALDGLTNLVPELQTAGSVLLIDFADHRIDACMLEAGHCVAARTLGSGLHDMPGAAASTERELQRTLASFRGAGAGAPTAIYVSGVGGEAESALMWLSGVLGQAVRPLALPSPTLPETAGGPAFGRAAALAARAVTAGQRIDLRKGEFAATEGRGQWMQYASMITTCIVAMIMTAMFSLKAQQKVLADEQGGLRENLTTQTLAILGKSVSDPAEVEALIKNPKNSDPLPSFDAFDALGAVSSAIPGDVAHEVKRLRVDVADEKRQGQLELVGLLESLGKRDRIVDELRKHPCFSEIELGKTSPGGSDNRINYTLEAVVQCPGQGNPKEKKRKVSGVAL
jgi:general secretion pathway protein L